MKALIGRGLRIAVGAAAMLALTGGPALALGASTVIVSTVVHDAQHSVVTSVPIGTMVHPSFVVSGASGTPSGQISVLKWNNGTCTGTHAYAYGGVLTNGALDAGFLAETSTTVTTISYRGSYKGDGVYAALDGPCRSVTFTKAIPSVVIAIHDSAHHSVTSVHVGDDVHVRVAVSGGVGQPTGTVKVYGWPGNQCSGAASIVGPYTLTAGSVDTPFQWPMTTAGTYAFRATYSGNSAYDPGFSACFVLTVQKYAPTFHVGLYDSAGQPATYLPSDEPVHVAATLSGPAGTPTGQVTLGRYSTADCSGPTQYSTGVSAAATMNPIGAPFTPQFAETLSFRVTYGGSGTYASATTCLAVTWRYDPTITLSMRNASGDIVTTVPIGTAVHPRIVVGPNGNLATGQATLTWSANGTCTGGTTLGSRSLVAGLVDDTTLKFVPKTAGTYSFRATYSGGPTYQPANSPCVVVKATAPVANPTPAPTPKPTALPSVSPTQAPAASSAPVSSEAPSLDPAASVEPSAAASVAPVGSPAPVAIGGAGATDGPDSTLAAGSSDPATDAGSSGGTAIWPFLLLLLVASVFIGVAATRRRRSGGAR